MPRRVSGSELSELEDLIDSCGLSNVLESLGDICFEKADHVASNWQDDNLSKLWNRAATHCNSAASRVMRMGLD